MKKEIFSLLLLITITVSAQANSYIIKSEIEFKNLFNKLIPGDEVIIADGTYTNWNLEINLKGAAKNPITIKAEHTGKVIFSGNTTQTLFKLSGDYLTISGINFEACILQKGTFLIELKETNANRITNCSFLKNVVKTQFTPLIVISGNGKNNIVDKCTFDGNIDNQDVQVKVTKESCPQFTLIENNTFKNKNKVSWQNGNGGECVQIGQDPILLGTIAANSVVRLNRFTKCNAENEVISNKSSSNKYTENYFEDNDGELVMRGGHDCIIADNTFNGGTGGIRINGTGHLISNNKIANIKTAIRLMYGMAKGKGEIGFYIAASNCIIKNNQISNATTGILIGDSKNVDWTGKFDTVRYPSRVLQDVAPYENTLKKNKFTATKSALIDLTINH